MKRKIRLTESDLHRIVKESVKRILREENLEWSEQGGVRYPDGEVSTHKLKKVPEVLVDRDAPLNGWHTDYEPKHSVEEDSKYELKKERFKKCGDDCLIRHACLAKRGIRPDFNFKVK